MNRKWWWAAGGLVVGVLVGPKLRAWLPVSLPGRG